MTSEGRRVLTSDAVRCICGEWVACYHQECLSLVTPCRRCGSVEPGLQDCYCAKGFGEPRG